MPAGTVKTESRQAAAAAKLGPDERPAQLARLPSSELNLSSSLRNPKTEPGSLSLWCWGPKASRPVCTLQVSVHNIHARETHVPELGRRRDKNASRRKRNSCWSCSGRSRNAVRPGGRFAHRSVVQSAAGMLAARTWSAGGTRPS